MATRPPPRQPLPRLAAAALLVLAGCTSYPAPPTQPNPPAPDGGSPPGTVEKPHVRILFIGNSLTSTNDLPAAVQALASAHVQGWAGVSVEAVAPGGKLLSGHLLDLQDAGTSLHALLGSSARWDFVVLQEQSQIPGLEPTDRWRTESAAAAASLAATAREAGATPVLYMTWGFWSGDPTLPALYPDFPTMAERLDQGYLDMARAIQPPPLVAPVGRGFRAAYDDTPGALEPGSLFRRLYADDRHPTPLGTYLASAVIVGTLSGEPVAGVSYTPAGVSPAEAAVLQRWAGDVVFAGRYADAGSP